MSATRVTLTSGELVIVHLSLTEMEDMFRRALVDGVPWELKSPDGKRLVINPYQVRHLQEADW